MTVLSRGDRGRRGGRRPGWLLLTVLLVLAITASSALVFTNRIELLKLAVIISLWAAVVGAFVSAMYRRQSESDQARMRELKHVYNLQLDREIFARREYELNVETHLRREMANELSAQSTDEIAALRAELAALRTNLEILFDADLGQRPAIENQAGYADWAATATTSKPDRVASSRITVVGDDDDDAETAESPIIDVPEEPLAPQSAPLQPVAVSDGRYGGSHRRPSETEETRRIPPVPAEPSAIPAGYGQSPASSPTVHAPNGQRVRQILPAESGRRGRHTGRSAYLTPGPAEAAPDASPDSSMTVPRHRGAEDDVSAAPTGGQSVAELLARLDQTSEARAGRRRRRRD